MVTSRAVVGHVQGGGRFVGDQQLGLASNRHGNRHALAHAAGQLVRVGVHAVRGAWDLDFFQQLDGPFARLFARHFQVQAQDFLDLETHGVAGVQRGHGVLEDHRQVLADDLPALASVEAEHVLAVEAQGVGGDDAGVIDQAHQRHHGHGFTRTRLADDGQDFALVHAQVEAIDHWHGVLVAEADIEILDF